MIELRGYQSDAIERVREALRNGCRAPLLVAPTGAGKCLARGTPVMLFDGRVLPVEQIEVGDLLMGPDSKPRRVLSLARGREEMFRITPRKGEPYVVNRSHVLSLRMTGGSLKSCGIPDGEIVNISVHDYLTRTKTFRHCAKGWRAAVDFPEHVEQMRLDPYFLGVWLGDGSSNGASITTGDAEIADCVRTYACGLGMTVREEANSPGSVALHMVAGKRGDAGRGHRTNPVKLALHQYGLLGNKHIPHRYKTASRSDRLELLAGILDTDGYWDDRGYVLCLKSERLFDDAVFVARSLGFSAYKRAIRKTCTNNGAVGNYWICSISGDVDAIPCRIPRKKAPPRRQKKDPLLTGISVESVGEDDYFGFEIAGPDRLFLLGDFTVTHNTVMFSFVASGASSRGKRVLILCHRKELIRQASRKLYDAGVEHGIIAPGFTPTRDLVQVASVQTLARRLAKGVVPFDLIVVDEAHHAIAGQWATVAAAYPDARMLGVTATPERLDGRGLGVEAGGCFDALVMGPTVADLVAGGFLTPTRIFAPAEAPDLSGVRTKGGDYDASALADAMGAPRLVGDAVEHYRRHAAGLPAILFSPSVAHAEGMAEAFRAAGFRAVSASGETAAAERDAAIAGLATGAVQVLCSCDLISEGLDVPVVGAVILLRPTKSLGLYLQQVGRGLRPAEGKTHLIVLDHAGNTLRHGPPEMPREWSLEGRPKRKKKDDDAPPARQCSECFAVHAPAPACPECGFVYPVKAREIEHVDGELSDVTDSLVARFGKHVPLRDVLRGAGDADLALIAKARGYKRGWVQHMLRERAARRGAAA